MKKLALLLLLLAPVARADGLYPGEVVFDYTTPVSVPGFPTALVRYAVEVFDVQPTYTDYWGFCQGPGSPLIAAPYCPTDDPIGFAIPNNVPYDFGTLTWVESYYLGGFAFNFPPPTVATPEPSTLVLLGACLAGLLLWKRWAAH